MNWRTVETRPQREPMEHGKQVLCYGRGEFLVGWLYDKFPKTICESEETILEDVTHWCELTEPDKLKQADVMLSLPERESAINAFIEIQKYQMKYVQLARTTELYKIAQNALIALGHDGNGA